MHAYRLPTSTDGQGAVVVILSHEISKACVSPVAHWRSVNWRLALLEGRWGEVGQIGGRQKRGAGAERDKLICMKRRRSDTKGIRSPQRGIKPGKGGKRRGPYRRETAHCLQDHPVRMNGACSCTHKTLASPPSILSPPPNAPYIHYYIVAHLC